MHVAICDDNVADRKHIERLLSRESDKRAGSTNILYIDSYGNKDHFLSGNPLKYNIIFMDMCSEPGIVEEILEYLERAGYNAPLILYSSKIDYTAIPDLPSYIIHAKKPYITEPLPDYLSLGDANAAQSIVTVFIHKESIINEVPKDSIMYALQNEAGCTLYLSDGAPVKVDEPIGDLRQIFEPFEEFKRVNKNSIVNFKYVSKVKLFTIIMKDTTRFFMSPLLHKEYKWLLEEMEMEEE
ncbi:MAG: hypothetical protein II247_01555 [Lachnospiraceae bacterium]|nr:hypothetical protein [Lachnospiraceae bacterium]